MLLNPQGWSSNWTWYLPPNLARSFLPDCMCAAEVPVATDSVGLAPDIPAAATQAP